jgi:hypothetical protein
MNVSISIISVVAAFEDEDGNYRVTNFTDMVT